MSEPNRESESKPGLEAADAFEAVLAPLRDPSRGRDTAVPMLALAQHEPAVPAGTEPLVRVANLRKTYGGKPALQDLSLELYAGQILALVGPNGAGKTSCLRILASILKADGGHITVAGHEISEAAKVRASIGYLPDMPGSYEDLGVAEYLEFFARAYAVPASERTAAIERALRTTSLLDQRDKLVEQLSAGAARRLGMARLLMHDPPLLLLDEPLAGLDHSSSLELHGILRGLSQQGKAVLLSANRLDEVSELAHRVGVLDQGRLLTLASTRELMNRLNDRRRWRLRLREEEKSQPLATFLEQQPEVRSVALSGRELYLSLQGGEAAVEALHHRLFENGFRLLEFAEEPMDNEELYRLLGGETR